MFLVISEFLVVLWWISVKIVVNWWDFVMNSFEIDEIGKRLGFLVHVFLMKFMWIWDFDSFFWKMGMENAFVMWHVSWQKMIDSDLCSKCTIYSLPCVTLHQWNSATWTWIRIRTKGLELDLGTSLQLPKNNGLDCKIKKDWNAKNMTLRTKMQLKIKLGKKCKLKTT